ncbi:hypothetical protein [Niabella ginsenosidivorans]|nr:hypothetical protein [Niabella ginsenosidivorans]
MLKILGADKEIISNNICFTGDAIALLNNYATTGKSLHLDDWDWYKELRSGAVCYIVTNIKEMSLPV